MFLNLSHETLLSVVEPLCELFTLRFMVLDVAGFGAGAEGAVED